SRLTTFRSQGERWSGVSARDCSLDRVGWCSSLFVLRRSGGIPSFVNTVLNILISGEDDSVVNLSPRNEYHREPTLKTSVSILLSCINNVARLESSSFPESTPAGGICTFSRHGKKSRNDTTSLCHSRDKVSPLFTTTRKRRVSRLYSKKNGNLSRLGLM